MDEIKDILQSQFAGTIDFKGQESYDWYSSIIIYVGVTLSVSVGFFSQDFEYGIIGLGATYVASSIFTLPIPAYRRHPVEWREPTPLHESKRVQVNL